MIKAPGDDLGYGCRPGRGEKGEQWQERQGIHEGASAKNQVFHMSKGHHVEKGDTPMLLTE